MSWATAPSSTHGVVVDVEPKLGKPRKDTHPVEVADQGTEHLRTRSSNVVHMLAGVVIADECDKPRGTSPND